MKLISQAVLLSTLLSTASATKAPRLAGGLDVSPSDFVANFKGAAAVGTVANKFNDTCNGVLTSSNTFVTSTSCSKTFENGTVYLGAQAYFKTNPEFNGEVLNVTGPPEFAPLNFQKLTISPLPEGSAAVPALLYPFEKTSPPKPGAECVGFGFWNSGPNSTWQLNSLPVTIIDNSRCADTYHILEGFEGIFFCALVLDPATGNSSICSADNAVVMMCRAWAGTSGRRQMEMEAEEAEEARRRCVLWPWSTWCAWVCATHLLPHCPSVSYPEETDDRWHLAGIQVGEGPGNSCGNGNKPTLFGYVSNANYT